MLAVSLNQQAQQLSEILTSKSC